MIAYTLIWQPAAVAGLIRSRTTDGQAAKAVRTSVTALAENANPSHSTPLGTGGLRRLRIGDARILYEILGTRWALLGSDHRRPSPGPPAGW